MYVGRDDRLPTRNGKTIYGGRYTSLRVGENRRAQSVDVIVKRENVVVVVERDRQRKIT